VLQTVSVLNLHLQPSIGGGRSSFHLDQMPLRTACEDLHAVAGHQHGVLELRAEAAVLSHRRPAIVPEHALRAPHRQHQLCTQRTVLAQSILLHC